jgi:hypothetical protein
MTDIHYNVGCGDALGPSFGACTPPPAPSPTPSSSRTPTPLTPTPATPTPLTPTPLTPTPATPTPLTPTPATPTPVVPCNTLSLSITDYYLGFYENDTSDNGMVTSPAGCSWQIELVNGTFDDTGAAISGDALSFISPVVNTNGPGSGWVGFKTRTTPYTTARAHTWNYVIKNSGTSVPFRVHVKDKCADDSSMIYTGPTILRMAVENDIAGPYPPMLLFTEEFTVAGNSNCKWKVCWPNLIQSNWTTPGGVPCNTKIRLRINVEGGYLGISTPMTEFVHIFRYKENGYNASGDLGYDSICLNTNGLIARIQVNIPVWAYGWNGSQYW